MAVYPYILILLFSMATVTVFLLLDSIMFFLNYCIFSTLLGEILAFLLPGGYLSSFIEGFRTPLVPYNKLELEAW